MHKEAQPSKQQDRVLARLLATDLRQAQAAVCECEGATVTATEQDGKKDITNLGGDAD